MDLLEKIKSLSVAYSDQIVDVRRYIHANPELSYQEFNTAKYVAAQLRAFGIEPTEGIVATGLIAEIRVKTPVKKR